MLLMAGAVVRRVVQALVGFEQCLFFGEQGKPLDFQFGVRHGWSLPPQPIGTIRAHAYGLRDESPDRSTDLTPTCPFCLRPGSLIASGTLDAWPKARVYRCSRCNT
jgi:hypothetical protein